MGEVSMSRLRVYVAGPLSKGDLNENIQAARDAGKRLMEAGFAPMLPQMSCFWEDNEPTIAPNGTTHDDWMGVDLPWVSVADAILRLPGDSVGADLETKLAAQLGIPVYHSLIDLIARPPVKGDARFHAVLRRIGALHDRKQADYGANGDPFANVRASQEWGIAPWLGALVRANDKVSRLKTFAQKGTLANEGVEDSMMDLAVYALIALVLFQEKQGATVDA